MNTNNLIKVKSIADESTGYFFQSSDEKKSFVIATKHGICNLKNDCEPYENKISDCCRNCTNIFDESKIELVNGNIKLKIKKILYENKKDIVLIEVSENSNTKLKINNNINSEKFYAFGFKNEQKNYTRLILDYPKKINSKIYYNLYSDPTPNLEEKKDSFYGISGSLITTIHDEKFAVKGIIIENGNDNDLIAEDLSELNFEIINDFFECKVFDTALFEIKLKNDLNEHFKIINKKIISSELELILYSPKKTGFPHYDINEICNAISNEFYQLLTPKKGNINFLPIHAANIISQNMHLEPVNKILTARVTEAYLNAPHLYSTSLNDDLYHHTHYLFINDGLDTAVSSYCGHNQSTLNIKESIEHIISNANYYEVKQNLLFERSFLDQNIDKEICDQIYDILFNHKGRINNFCLIFSISMELFYNSCFDEVNDYILNIMDQACETIDDVILKKLKYGLNLHVIVIPMNQTNEITEKFLKDLNGES
nr:hypothetical protein [Acinetobacter oleivorans]